MEKQSEIEVKVWEQPNPTGGILVHLSCEINGELFVGPNESPSLLTISKWKKLKEDWIEEFKKAVFSQLNSSARG